MDRRTIIPILDRIRYIGYGVIGGLVAGMFLGWMLHGWVGFIVKLFFVIILLLPLAGAIYFWRRVTTTPPRVSTTVRDADWIEIEASAKPRR